jgi:hypothetical protein
MEIQIIDIVAFVIYILVLLFLFGFFSSDKRTDNRKGIRNSDSDKNRVNGTNTKA